MKLNINEKKALYTFGCPNHRATVDRLQMLAAITPDPVAGELCNQAECRGSARLVSLLLPHAPHGNGRLL